MQTPKPAPRKGDAHWEKFEDFEAAVSGRQPGWLQALRRAGIARFAETGFPTTSDEDWRFTNVAPIARMPFRPVFEPSRKLPSVDLLRALTFGALEASLLVFVDGHYAPELSRIVPQPGGLQLLSLAAALQKGSPVLERHLGRHARIESSPFAALNVAFFTDGALIHIPAGETVAAPIHLLHIATSPEFGAAVSARHLVVAEAGSRATVLETYVGTGAGAYLTNTVTELVIGEGAKVEHCKFQDESASAYHVATLHAALEAHCDVITHSIVLGSKLARNGIQAVLAGEGIECILNGLYLTNDDQLADHHMVVEHAQPHCNSHEYFNGILDGRSRGVFHGRILVRPEAQKTDAKQTNKNLLLSDDAGVNTKPQLEIYADDVKCTHGATIGQLNDESIFYLRARGIGREMARRMLMHAFAGEITARIRHESIREELDQLLWERLEQNRLISVAR